MNGKRTVSIVLMCILALSVGCASAATRGGLPSSVPAPALAPGKENYSGDAGGTSPAGDAERMIVRSASLSLVVKDTEISAEEIKVLTAGFGGYVVQTQIYRQDGLLRGTITVRIPAEALDEAILKFKALAVRVENDSSSAQDVTEEYADLGAQLRNLEATEHELQELLTTVREKTGKAEDILAVHRELTNIRGQIERLNGRKQYLERTAAMAAVTIQLVPDLLAQPITSEGWRPLETLSNAFRALLRSVRWIADAFIVLLIYVLPIAGIAVVPWYVLWRLWRRRRNPPTPKS